MPFTKENAKAIGSKGGKAGRGDKKRRPKEHYVKAGKKRWSDYKVNYEDLEKKGK